MPSVPIDRVIEEVRRALKRGDIVRTVGMVRELVRQARQDPRTRHLQAITALEFGQARDAVALLETLIFELTGDPLREATVDLARAREMQGDLENALLTLRPELESDDTPPAAIASAARITFRQGDAAGAIAMLENAKADEKQTYHLAGARGFIALNTPADDPELGARTDAAIAALTAESERVGVPASSLMPLLIDLGELHARRGEDGAAARAWKRSASLSPNKADPRTYAQSVGGMLKSWSGKPLERAKIADLGPGAETERPVFVVGMPGGGAALASTLLAASPEVEATADPESLTAAVGRFLAPQNASNQAVVPDPSRVGGKQLADAAAAYLARTEPRGEGITRVVDPFELNIHTLGVIAQMFPKASVIFVRRAPFDACLAGMLAHRDPRLLYANEPQSLAVFAGGIARLSTLWEEIFAGDHLPLRHVVVDHEALLTDPSVRRSLFETVGLAPPDDATLESIAAACAGSTRTGSGLEARFAQHLPQLAEAAGQIGLDRV